MLGKNLGLIKSIFGLVRAVSTRVALESEMVGRLFPNTCDALAIIRPEKLEAVQQELIKCDVYLMTVSDVRGCGRQRGYTEQYRGTEFQVRLLPKLKLEIAVNEALVEPTVEAIAQAGLYPANCRLLDPAEALLNGVAESGAVLLLAFESADHPLDAWMSRALALAADAGGTCPRGPSYRDAGEKAREGESARWREAFFAAPYLQSALVSLGIIADTFETACTWDLFEELHAGVGHRSNEGEECENSFRDHLPRCRYPAVRTVM